MGDLLAHYLVGLFLLVTGAFLWGMAQTSLFAGLLSAATAIAIAALLWGAFRKAGRQCPRCAASGDGGAN